MRPFAIAGLQLHISAARDNKAYIKARIDHLMAVFPWVQLVLLSELATFGPSPRKGEPLPGPTEREYQELARKHGIWLVPGSLFELRDGKRFNTASVIDPEGRVVTRYSKMFPFEPYEDGVEPGTEFCIFDIAGVGRFGLSICYDIWFPETSRTLVAQGVEVILHPVMTTTIDRPVELAIAQATAATCQCYVVDVNGVGDGGNGRSIIVGPDGDVLYEAGRNEETIPLELDLDRVTRSREFGLRRLGQPLKSFRDNKVPFTVYSDPAKRSYLDSLGPMQRHKQRADPASEPGPVSPSDDGRE